jgi:hypothetical protein
MPILNFFLRTQSVTLRRNITLQRVEMLFAPSTTVTGKIRHQPMLPRLYHYNSAAPPSHRVTTSPPAQLPSSAYATALKVAAASSSSFSSSPPAHPRESQPRCRCWEGIAECGRGEGIVGCRRGEGVMECELEQAAVNPDSSRVESPPVPGRAHLNRCVIT